MSEHVTVNFEVTNRDKFMAALQKATEDDGPLEYAVVGYRQDDGVDKREALAKFANAMELKLRKNDHKTSWRELPIEALYRQMKLEIQELEVAMDFLTALEARDECVDIANFALILWDRLSLLREEEHVRQHRIEGPARDQGTA